MRNAFLLIFFVLFVGIVGSAVLPVVSDFVHKQVIQLSTAVPVPSPTPANTYNITAEIDPKLKSTNGLNVYDFADKVTNARDLQFTPGGVLLVSETSEGRVVALPDRDKNGKADEVKTVLKGLKKPHGLAFYQGKLFVAEENKVVRYIWNEADLTAQKEKDLFSLPSQFVSRHFTRGLEFDKAGNLYVSVGSTCDTCLESNDQLASVLITNADGSSPQVYAKGLRNAVFLKLNQKTDQIWTTEMGRDMLGDNIPPDEINILQKEGNYGWPYCYGNQVKDNTFKEGNPIDCLNTVSPIYQIPAHSAPLGLTFIQSAMFPDDWQGDLLVAYHGSWNRTTPTGFKVVHQKVSGNTVISEEDFLTGFLNSPKPSDAVGRPVDLEFDQNGHLFVSDDKAGKIYMISAGNRAQ